MFKFEIGKVYRLTNANQILNKINPLIIITKKSKYYITFNVYEDGHIYDMEFRRKINKFGGSIEYIKYSVSRNINLYSSHCIGELSDITK